MNPDFKNKLRKKFIETAKKYMGVPYGKKFHKEGSELYNAPLFLDCCALVRKAMWDLKEEFGFILGGGHQSYQFDTLPVERTEEEAEPGDLIFYSATYFPEKKLKPR